MMVKNSPLLTCPDKWFRMNLSVFLSIMDKFFHSRLRLSELLRKEFRIEVEDVNKRITDVLIRRKV